MLERSERICLCSGSWYAEVMPEHGMNLIRLCFRDEEILRSPAPNETASALSRTPFLYGMPLLFPAGRVRDGIVHSGAHCYMLPINEPQRNNHLHGFFHDAPFSLTHRTASSAVGVYRNSDRKRFPLDIEMEADFRLDDTGIVQSWRLTNMDEDTLPVSFALHTAFCVPRQFSVSAGRKWELDDRFCATGAYAEKSILEQQLTGGMVPPAKKLSGMYEMIGPARIGRFEYLAQPPFDTWVIYNGGSTEYLCIEPQCGIGLEVANHPPMMLAPRQSVCFESRLRAL